MFCGECFHCCCCFFVFVFCFVFFLFFVCFCFCFLFCFLFCFYFVFLFLFLFCFVLIFCFCLFVCLFVCLFFWGLRFKQKLFQFKVHHKENVNKEMSKRYVMLRFKNNSTIVGYVNNVDFETAKYGPKKGGISCCFCFVCLFVYFFSKYLYILWGI